MVATTVNCTTHLTALTSNEVPIPIFNILDMRVLNRMNANAIIRFSHPRWVSLVSLDIGKNSELRGTKGIAVKFGFGREGCIMMVGGRVTVALLGTIWRKCFDKARGGSRSPKAGTGEQVETWMRSTDTRWGVVGVVMVERGYERADSTVHAITVGY